MKTTSLFKAVALVAIMVASVLNSEVKAQDGFITNQVMNGELVASKTIFKQEGSYLQRHMQYTFTYDNQNKSSFNRAWWIVVSHLVYAMVSFRNSGYYFLPTLQKECCRLF